MRRRQIPIRVVLGVVADFVVSGPDPSMWHIIGLKFPIRSLVEIKAQVDSAILDDGENTCADRKRETLSDEQRPLAESLDQK